MNIRTLLAYCGASSARHVLVAIVFGLAVAVLVGVAGSGPASDEAAQDGDFALLAGDPAEGDEVGSAMADESERVTGRSQRPAADPLGHGADMDGEVEAGVDTASVPPLAGGVGDTVTPPDLTAPEITPQGFETEPSVTTAAPTTTVAPTAAPTTAAPAPSSTTAPSTTAPAPATTAGVAAEDGWVDAGHGVMVPPVLLEIRFCESRHDYTAANPSSSARGAYQFLTGSWAAYGHAERYGVDQAHLATPAQQDEAALITWQQSGTTPWNASIHCWG